LGFGHVRPHESGSRVGNELDVVVGRVGGRRDRSGVDGTARPRVATHHGRGGARGGRAMISRMRARWGRWRSYLNRSEWMWRLLSLPPAPQDDRPGLVMIQIDGFS